MVVEKESLPNEYFLKLDQALKAYGQVTPTLVIDLEYLDHNLNFLKNRLPKKADFRLVAKSLPSVELIDYCCNRLGTKRLMTFSLPMLIDLSRHNSVYQQMLGKPMPVATAAKYYDLFSSDSEAAQNVLWLIDTNERLLQYLQLAQSRGIKLNIILELDVGLRRGGFGLGEDLEQALKVIREHDHLKFSGLMGYDPHVPHMPDFMNWQHEEKDAVRRRYLEAAKLVGDILGKDVADGMIKNAGGSPTFHYYNNTSIANELAAGSLFVKPSDFDLRGLEHYKPAAFIASPALKVIDKPLAPGFPRLSPLLRMAGVLPEKVIFLYGGKWMAEPIYPEGLKYYSIMGRSSNQEALAGSGNTELETDDFVFLRPSQSEFVLLQFGEILVYDGREIRGRWSVFPVHG